VSSLAVTNLVKAFGAHQVLTGLSLRVEPGTTTALLGPSGSGKTTLLRIVCGFERASSGTVEIDGEVVDDATHHVAPERRRIGYVPQEGNLFPHLSVAGNVGFGLPRGAASRRRVAELLELVGLSDRGRSYPHQLSGGQQQRVALARALAVDPRLVLLDEPFASLDASLRSTVRSEVMRILRDAHATVLLVTHDQDEALSLADEVAVIRDGVVAQVASPQTLYASPVDAGLAGFVGDVNLLAGVVRGGEVETAIGRLALALPPPGGAVSGGGLPGGSEVSVLVRPEQLALTAAHRDDAGACEVIGHEFYGHDAVVRLRPVQDSGVALIARVRGQSSWAPGSVVTVAVEGAAVAWSRTSD
jgi:iron(III) transport system ATP-binding protein